MYYERLRVFEIPSTALGICTLIHDTELQRHNYLYLLNTKIG